VSTTKAPLLSLIKPGAAALEALLRSQRQELVSYPDAGATRTGLPAAYRHSHHVARLGAGEATFTQAIDGLRRWRPHIGAGIDVHPPNRCVEPGATVVLIARLGPVHAVVASRIVYVLEDTDRFGFAYGTLPHHLLEGEEAFVVERDSAGTVRFTISAFFRPASEPLRLVAPAVHALDQRLIRRYLRAMKQYITRGPV
jgi:uncharacterized protein (UPF0548 family)